MNGGRFLLAIVAGTLIGAAIAGCPEVGQTGCSDPDNSNYACGVMDPCHCFNDPDANVGLRDPGACSVPNPCKADGGVDASADGPTADATDATIPSCTGQCLPNPPWPWSAPVLLAFTTDGGLPGCPPVAPVGSGPIYADLDAGLPTCSPCECEPSDGGCSLPLTITASTATCAEAGPDSLSRSFDPPIGWDGGCTTQNAVPGDTCAKGSATCIQSVMIAPLTIDDGCAVAPQEPAPPLPPIAWGTLGLVCTSGASGTCASLDETCGPAGATGFQQCISQSGVADCPADAGPYVEPHVFYQGIADTRGCSVCACGPVQGSSCTGSVSVFTDSVCSTAPLDMIAVSATMQYCVDVLPGSALMSKSATAPAYTPGMCTGSDAGPTGSAQGTMPATFCCVPM